ncbi:MAG: CrcB family protein [Actinomycetota bacterium]|nr:CrcB family protein [Actinomycetota bacterium]
MSEPGGWDVVEGGNGPPDVFRPARSSPGPAHALARLRREADVLAVIALGGGLGSLARYGVADLLPTREDGFPWSTFIVNMAGCLLIGVLIVFVTDVWRTGRYARPFLGIGVLGGLTTYSAMMLDLRTLGAGEDWLLADVYLIGTLVGGLVGVWLGVTGTRLATRTRVRPDRGHA